MGSTMVRVEEQIHTQLREWSAEESKSIGQVISDLVKARKREEFWHKAEEDFKRLRADPGAWADYRQEAEEWQTLTGDTLADEPPYYTPEEEAEIRAHGESEGR